MCRCCSHSRRSYLHVCRVFTLLPALSAPPAGAGETGAYLPSSGAGTKMVINGMCSRHVMRQEPKPVMFAAKCAQGRVATGTIHPNNVDLAGAPRRHLEALCCPATNKTHRSMALPASAVHKDKAHDSHEAHRHVSGDEHKNGSHGRSLPGVGPAPRRDHGG